MTGPELALDSAVKLHHLPGHRSGMLALAVDTDEGRVVLCSDVAKNAREFLSRMPAVSDPDSLEVGRKSIDATLELADAPRGESRRRGSARVARVGRPGERSER